MPVTKYLKYGDIYKKPQDIRTLSGPIYIVNGDMCTEPSPYNDCHYRLKTEYESVLKTPSSTESYRAKDLRKRD